MITCGQSIHYTGSFRGSRCQREAKWTLVDHPDLSQVYCNVHKSGKMRRKYATYEFKPLTEEMLVTLRRLLAERNEAERIASEKRQTEQATLNEHYRAEAWAALAAEPTLTVEETKFWSTDRDKQWEYTVQLGTHQWGINFDLRTEGEGYPYGIRLRSTGNLTPNEARMLASVLGIAAAKADALNAEMEA